MSSNLEKKMNEIWAYTAENEDGEGIIAEVIEGAWFPFISSRKSVIDRLKPLAEDVSKMKNKKIKLVRFSLREEIEEIDSSQSTSP